MPPDPTKPPITHPADYPPWMVRPVWADPSYLMAVTSYQTTDVDDTAGPQSLVAPANPGRWAIGFSGPSGLAATVYLAPYADVGAYPLVQLTTTDLIWLELFKYGPMVTREWWALFPPGVTIRVHELVNQ